MGAVLTRKNPSEGQTAYADHRTHSPRRGPIGPQNSPPVSPIYLVYYPGQCVSHWDCDNKELNLCLRGLGARQQGRQAAVKHSKQPVNSKQLPDSCCAPTPKRRAPHALSYLINAVTSWVSTIFSHSLTHCVACGNS